MSARTSLALLACALAGVGANCEQCQPIPDPRRGNVDRVADAVLVTGTNRHTYLVTSNPEIQHLRVLDLTDERFADGPNRFFPLSIPVGPETRMLATAPSDDDFVFALDSGTNQVFMVRTPSSNNGTPFTVVGDPIDTANAPGDIAVVKRDGRFVLFIAPMDTTTIETITVDNRAREQARGTIDLPPGVVPGEIAVDPDERTLVVTDLVGSSVHIVDLAVDPPVYDRSLDIGGPQGAVAIGAVDVGDGIAPVALVARRDAEAVWAVRLAREGALREDKYAVLGGTDVGALPLAVYVPDHRDVGSRTVCCRGLSTSSIDAGEATSAWGAVALANGTVLYLALAAPFSDAQRLVRLIDDDPAGLAQEEIVEGELQLYVPGPGDEASERRPDAPVFTEAADFGDPPFVEHVDNDESLLLVWEGAQPALTNLRVDLDTFPMVSLTSQGSFVDRGARLDDVASFTTEDDNDCDPDGDGLRARIVAVTRASITVATGDGTDALDLDEQACLAGNGQVRVTILVNDAFAVTTRDNTGLGRLALLPRAGDCAAAIPDDCVLALPGATMTLRASANGPPTPESRLAIPLDPHVSALGLDLAEATSAVAGEGGFGQAGYVFTAILGDAMRFPDPLDDTKIISARRMVVTTGSTDSVGLNVVFSCDEAETLPALCETYR